MNNLSTLNDTLFDTLNKVKSGEMKPEEAKVINEIATTIINNSKVQLDAIKVTKGLGSQARIFGVQSPEGQPQIGSKNLYDYKMEFAISKNYKNVAECISGLGSSTQFEMKFKQWCASKSIDLSKVQSE